MGFFKKVGSKIRQAGRWIDKKGINKIAVGVAGVVAAPFTGGMSLAAASGVTALMNKKGVDEAITSMAQAASNAGVVDTSKVAKTIAKIDQVAAKSPEIVKAIAESVQNTAKNLELPKPALAQGTVSVQFGNESVKVEVNESIFQKIKKLALKGWDFVKQYKYWFIGGAVVVVALVVLSKKGFKNFRIGGKKWRT